jgi:hypothetical protein
MGGCELRLRVGKVVELAVEGRDEEDMCMSFKEWARSSCWGSWLLREGSWDSVEREYMSLPCTNWPSGPGWRSTFCMTKGGVKWGIEKDWRGEKKKKKKAIP